LQVEEFIAQLGIRGLSQDSESTEKQLVVKQKLKTAKRELDVESEDARSLEGMKKNVTETKKKNKFQNKVFSATSTTKTVDWISSYQPRKYLLVKPGGKWYNERVNQSSFPC